MFHAKFQNEFALDRGSFGILGLGLALSICALLLFSWLADEVLEGDTARFDTAVRTLIHVHSTDRLTEAMKVFTTVGSSLILLPAIIVALSLYWYYDEHRAFVTLGLTAAGAVILESGLKLLFHRARPVPFFDLPTPHSYSFPSGHALSSFCLCGAFALELSRHCRRMAWKLAIWLSAIPMTSTIGFSRIYLGVHYPTDVVAGYAAGFIWLVAVNFADRTLIAGSASPTKGRSKISVR